MAQRDYYEILGVSKSASADEIRKAYRQKARQYHPDVCKEPDAAQRFAEVQDAYEVLSDAEKRKLYDKFGHAGVSGAASGAGAGAGAGGARWSTSTSSGQPFEAGDFSSIFEEMFGTRGGPFGSARTGARPGAAPYGPRPHRGRDVEHTLNVSFMTAARGGDELLRINAVGSKQEIAVKIPPGIDDGAKLRIRGKGQPGTAGGAPGDVILTIRIGKHPYFRREGLDLLLDVPISVAEAALGTTVTVPLLDGSSADLKIPAGSSSGQRLRIKGKGLTDAKEKTGDYLAVVQIVAPAKLTADARELVERLKTTLPNPRADVPWAR